MCAKYTCNVCVYKTLTFGVIEVIKKNSKKKEYQYVCNLLRLFKGDKSLLKAVCG